jgi:type I restriction enzyme S subunit
VVLDDASLLLHGMNLPLLRPNRNVASPRYLHYVCNHFRNIGRFSAIAQHAVNQSSINQKTLSAMTIPLAPRDEQDGIVAEIEKQFTRLDDGVDTLKSVSRRLQTYRRAVLHAAMAGTLIPHQVVAAAEDGVALLQRILALRRLQLRSARRVYREPLTEVPHSLPAIPKGWTWTSVEALSTKVVDGVHKKPTYVSDGIPVVTVRNLTAGQGISFERLNYITSDDHRQFIQRADPERGDLLISKDGTLGVIRAVRTDAEFSIFVSVALIKPVLREMTDYLEVALSSPQVQRQMVPKGSGLQHIHLEDLRQDFVPLPPLSEQSRIAAGVQRRLSVLDALSVELAAATKKAERLRNAILRSAFDGTLLNHTVAEVTA